MTTDQSSALPHGSSLQDTAWKRHLQAAVHSWYPTHGRRLPWREAADPYRIWISEIMLQQTTTAAVIPYFERFTARFPDVRSLAAAEESAVLKLWEGLGYYSRARNLHAAAQLIVSQWNGRFPESLSLLQQLPGVGRYTAGAIMSFAFRKPAPILEANTLRLYARLMALTADPRSAVGQRALWGFAEWLVQPADASSRLPAGDFNQALMDLGATVCRPVDPACPECPLQTCCAAFRLGAQARIPPTRTRAAITRVTEVSFAITRRGRYLLRQRTASEWWTGLWDFVRFEITGAEADALFSPAARRGGRRRSASTSRQPALFSDAELTAANLASLPPGWTQQIAEQTGLTVTQGRLRAELRHAVTRYQIRLLCFEAVPRPGSARKDSGYRWFSAAELEELPLSTTGREFATRLQLPPAAGVPPAGRTGPSARS